MAFTIDSLNRDGTLNTASVPWKTARCTWALDDPGSLEIDLRVANMGDWYLCGQRRLRLMDSGTARFTGWLERLQRSGSPDDVQFKASALGLSSALEHRVVHGDTSWSATGAATIAWNLINHAQGQTNGNYGFTLGTITGAQPSRARHYCDGDNILESIDELAAKDTNGFDWEITPAGLFNAWIGGRGSASGLTIADTDTMDFEADVETVDLLTYVTVLGNADEPCGAPLEIRSSGLATTYGRREETIDLDESNDVTEMDQAGDQELTSRGKARTRVKVGWLERAGYRPWTFGAVWLGDTVTVNKASYLGGNELMRCVTISIYLETEITDPFVEMEFQVA